MQCTDDFTDQPKVINGVSELFRDVFGEKGIGARSAVGMSLIMFFLFFSVSFIILLFQIGANALPAGITVEVEAIFEIEREGSNL